MFNLTSADFANVVNFHKSEMDGYETSLLCIGKKLHLRQDAEARFLQCPEGESFRVIGACDGSCEARTDLRELINGLSECGSPLHLGGEVRRMLRDNETLDAVLYESSYGKRFSEWKDYCLNGQSHVRVTIDLSCMSDEDEDPGHSVVSGPCDWSCKAPVDLDRKAISGILREVRRHDV
jgi:hypothetical protein